MKLGELNQSIRPTLLGLAIDLAIGLAIGLKLVPKILVAKSKNIAKNAKLHHTKQRTATTFFLIGLPISLRRSS